MGQSVSKHSPSSARLAESVNSAQEALSNSQAFGDISLKLGGELSKYSSDGTRPNLCVDSGHAFDAMEASKEAIAGALDPNLGLLH